MMGLIKERMKSGEECCKLANERFGLQMGMRKLLERFNLNDHAVDYVIELAQKRELEKLDEVLSHIGTWGVNKVRYIRIVK
ncbi:MAG: hypothetical protein JKY50_00420 [Oleispira sp.]|nr:hypothetical protein [Oleispira sp.]